VPLLLAVGSRLAGFVNELEQKQCGIMPHLPRCAHRSGNGMQISRGNAPGADEGGVA
jgi:hypothetical protein